MASWLGAVGRAAAAGASAALDALTKAAGPDEGPQRAPGGAREDTSRNAPVPTLPAEKDPKTLFWDPFTVLEQLGWKERPSQITYNTLKAMTWRMPVLSAVLQTRINQIAQFARPQVNRFEIGFRIRTRDPLDKPSPADKKFIDGMQTFMTRTGVTDNPRGRVSFEKFLRKLSWDMLVYDQDVFEIVPNRKGQPAEFYAVDGSSIRLADTARLHMDEDLDDAVRYVQIYDGAIINEYTQEELCFGVRNVRTDMRLYGYGVSELEMLVNAVTSLLWAWEYNSRAFSQGSMNKGLINIKGAIPERQLAAFKRQWYAMVTGVENAFRTPILNAADEVQWLNMQNSNRDMEFNAWMDFLIKVCCSMYLMDPSEINFKYGNVGQRSGLSEDSNRDKVIESRERGLRPLLHHIEDNLNQYVVWPINENFCLEFVGLDAMNRDQVADLNLKRVKSYRTVDELRAEDDLPPLPDGEGSIILDPVFAQARQAKQMQQMSQQQGGLQDGLPGAANGDEKAEGPAPKGRPGAQDDDFDDEDDEGEEDEDFGKSLRRQAPRRLPVRRQPVTIDLTL